MNDNSTRTRDFARNTQLEELLKTINSELWIAEKNIIEDIKIDSQIFPLIFIVGSLRSGTTLMTQWLANLQQFAYPSNLLSRFYQAPIIGAQIQCLLTDPKYNFRNEILDFQSKIEYISENGKTKGALSPNEFWYFWRRFLPFKDIDYLPEETLLESVNTELFKKELYGLTQVFHKPFALKAMICNYNISFLNKIFDKAIFIYTKRDIVTNIESALQARERQLGSVTQWYSFKIPEYNELIKINDPIKQVAGQIEYTNNAIKKDLEKVPDSKKIILRYEDFCNNPEKYYIELIKKINTMGGNLKENYIGPDKFDITKKHTNNLIEEKYKEFLKGEW